MQSPSYRLILKVNRPLVIALTFAIVAAVIAANLFTPNSQPFGYVGSPALSSPNLSTGNETVYAPWFENTTYTGDVLAISVAKNGAVDTLIPDWHAKLQIEAQNFDTGRFIVTTDGATTTIPFRFCGTTGTPGTDCLTVAQALNFVSADDLNFVRGDHGMEIANGGGLRNRNFVLGDIIHNSPVYVAGPNAGFTFTGYPAYAVANSGRSPRVVFGANDGMVHVLDAANGNEVFAFVPSPVIQNLEELTFTPYQHRYFVDGPFNAGDVCFNSCAALGDDWHTIVVGGLGAGGKGIFALDLTKDDPITDETNTDPSGAGSKVLWEFTNTDDPDLGFTYSRPSLVRLNSGQWAIVTGNGYVNNGTGTAALFVLKVEDGTLIRKLTVPADPDGDGTDNDTLTDPNGLSSPAVVDENGNFRADTVYAGDIKGNLWEFDISDVDETKWKLANSDKPLFTATDSNGVAQAITTAPDVTFHPQGGFLIAFGTGRLFDGDDVFSTQTQSLYGIWDNNWASGELPKTTDLVQQTQTFATHLDGDLVRTSTNLSVIYSAISPATTKKGWKVNLSASERVLTNPVIRDKRVQLVTISPTGGGTNYLVQVDFLTGGSPKKIAIDVNKDDLLTTADNVDGNNDGDTVDVGDRVVALHRINDFYGLASQPTFGILSATQDTSLINHLRAIPPQPIPPVLSCPPGVTGADEILVECEDTGLVGGHIDVDTSTSVYDFSAGTTNKHVHQWDDKTGLTSIDYFNIYDTCATPGDQTTCTRSTGFDHINDTIGANTPFYLIVANAELSPGATLEFNGGQIGVVPYEQRVAEHLENEDGDLTKARLPVYILGTPTATQQAAGVQQLTSFSMSFDPFAILTGGILPTETGCVRGNDVGAFGEYRNGALIVQAIDASASTPLIDNLTPITATNNDLYPLIDPDGDGSPGNPALLWESTVFWHWSGGLCFGEAGFTDILSQCLNGNFALCISPPKGDKDKESKKKGGADKDAKKGKKKKKKKKKKKDEDTPPPDDDGTVSVDTTTPDASDSGQNITNTTGSGNNQSGRLLWRELVF